MENVAIKAAVHNGGQTKCRVEKRVIQHNRTDTNSADTHG